MRRTVQSVLAAVALATAACTSGGETATTEVVVTTTTEPATVREDDGVLRIGVLIPTGDTGVGASLEATFQEAIALVNDAGGVLGNDVVPIIANEGPTSGSAAGAVLNLAARGVDAIIGPTSSNSAFGALETAVESGLLMCSPTASAIVLDDFPDDGLFFRTIATDSLQAVAIATQAELTGARDIAIVHVDDAYGRPYAEAVVTALAVDDVADVSTVRVGVDDEDLSGTVEEIADTGASVLIVLGSAEDSAQILAALGNDGAPEITDIIVNDAARGVEARSVIADLPTELRERIVGVAPQLVLPDANEEDEDTPLPFASQVTDCVNLISLAVLQAQSDSPPLFATQMSSVSSGGSVCRNFQECAERLEDREIDYSGGTGITELGRNGDPSRAWFDRFRFDEDGRDFLDNVDTRDDGRFAVAFDS